MSDHLGRRMAMRTCPQASRHSWQQPRLHAWLTHQARGWPTAGIGSGILWTAPSRPRRQSILFCAFAMDRQLTAEAAHIGGYGSCPDIGAITGRDLAQTELPRVAAPGLFRNCPSCALLVCA